MKRWTKTFAQAIDAVSQKYLDDLGAYAKANPRIELGMTVAIYSEDDEFQAYGRVIKTEWIDSEDSHVASILLYGGTVCSVPEYRLERVKWRQSITAALLKLHKHPCDQ